MDWTLLFTLLAKFGPEVFDFAVNKLSSTSDPTLDEINQLRQLIGIPGEQLIPKKPDQQNP